MLIATQLLCGLRFDRRDSLSLNPGVLGCKQVIRPRRLNHQLKITMISSAYNLVGVAGFEPTISCSRSTRINQTLLHTENCFLRSKDTSKNWKWIAGFDTRKGCYARLFLRQLCLLFTITIAGRLVFGLGDRIRTCMMSCSRNRRLTVSPHLDVTRYSNCQRSIWSGIKDLNLCSLAPKASAFARLS